MKNLATFCFMFLVIYNLSAQKEITISEGGAPKPGVSKSFTITISQEDLDFVKSSWNKYLEQQQGSSGIITKSGNTIQIETEHVALSDLNNKLVDIITLMTPSTNKEGDDVVSLTIYMECENSTHLSPGENEVAAKKIKDWLLDFDRQLNKNGITRN